MNKQIVKRYFIHSSIVVLAELRESDKIIYGNFNEATIIKRYHVNYFIDVIFFLSFYCETFVKQTGTGTMNEIILVYITNPNSDHAEKVSKHLIEKRLAACTNIYQINSMFHWKGDVENEGEYVVIAKTTPGRADDLEKAVAEVHEYEVPCILRISAHANDSYYKWIKEEVK